MNECLPWAVRPKESVLSIGLAHKIMAVGCLLFIMTTGCTRADEADCDQAYEKWIELKTRGEPEAVRLVKVTKLEEQRPRFLSECVGKTARSVIECWLAATDKTQLAKCE